MEEAKKALKEQRVLAAFKTLLTPYNKYKIQYVNFISSRRAKQDREEYTQ